LDVAGALNPINLDLAADQDQGSVSPNLCFFSWLFFFKVFIIFNFALEIKLHLDPAGVPAPS